MESKMFMKTVVMTGGTAGFGAVAAERISNTPNTKLILGARDNKNSSIDILPLDLARLSNVRSFVQALTKKLDGTKIDSLIMNAGAQFGNTKHRTGDGFESTFAINHLAHYLLLRLLTPSLARNATIVITTSDVHDPEMVPFGPKELDPEALAHPKDKGNGFIPGIRAYASSKLCDLLTARAFEISTDAQMNGMRVIAYNPGLTPRHVAVSRVALVGKVNDAGGFDTSSPGGDEYDRAGGKCDCRPRSRNDRSSGWPHVRLTGEG
jgi:NAD(P)-dependent dehydrogenase (short-subunit alcohol dehydrogenase family)